MTEGVFAIVGVVVGVAGTLAVDLVRARRDEARDRRGTLREAAVGFGSAVSRMKQALVDLDRTEDLAAGIERIRQAHEDARINVERLRLASNSVDAQRAARLSFRYAYGMWRVVDGLTPRADEVERGPAVELEGQLQHFYWSIRRELGLSEPDAVYSDPPELQLPRNTFTEPSLYQRPRTTDPRRTEMDGTSE